MATKLKNPTGSDITLLGQVIAANGEYTLQLGEADRFFADPPTLALISSGGVVVSRDGVDLTASQFYIEGVIARAIAFGQTLITAYAAQNVLLGITQAGMTSTVRERMAGVISALQTGSLYDVIAEAKAIPSGDKDATFITDARLLSFVNQVETYLGIALSTSL